MPFRKSARLWATLTAAWFAVVGCTSGEFRGFQTLPGEGRGGVSGASGADAGTTGALAVAGSVGSGAGAGGASAVAGSSAGGGGSVAEAGGGAGVAGTVAGLSGTASGGVAGAVEGGEAGAMEPASGGESNAGAGVGGTGTIGGAAGTGGVSGTSGAGGGGHKVCAEACANDDDCLVLGFDQGYRCHRATRRCEGFADPCSSSIQCWPGPSSWFLSCENDEDCFFFSDDACVDVTGVGFCARRIPDEGCPAPLGAVTLPRFGVSGIVEVCADTMRYCLDGACSLGCESNLDCTPERNGSVCDRQSGRCRCTADLDCGGPGVSRCNVESGDCECVLDTDCAELVNSDVCHEGRCGCSSASACTTSRFSGTTDVCE